MDMHAPSHLRAAATATPPFSSVVDLPGEDLPPDPTTVAGTRPKPPSALRGFIAAIPHRTWLLAGAAALALIGAGVSVLNYKPANTSIAWDRATGEPTVAPIPQAVAAPVATPVTAAISVEPSQPPSPVIATPVPPTEPASPVPDAVRDLRALRDQARALPAVTLDQQTAARDARMGALVTEIAAATREALELAVQLRQQLDRDGKNYRDSIEDMRARLAYLEARKAVDGLLTGSQPPAPPVAAASTPRPPAQRPGGATSYRVTSAAPKLASLAVSNPGAGQQARIEVEPSTDVPGFGKVLRIEQRGTAWQVVTERGVITQ